MELAAKEREYLKSNPGLSREELIDQYLPQVKHIVYRISSHLPSNVETDDLISAGIVGLIEGAERYEPSRDNKFMTYAAFRIKGAILSELRSRDYLSRSSRRKIREIQKVYVRMENRLGREAKDEEVAQALNLSIEEFNDLKRMANISFISFEDVGVGAQEDKENLVKYLTGRNSEDAFALTTIKEMEKNISRVIDELPEKEKLVVSLYYWEELTMKEIGRVLDVTESRVSQLHSQALARMRVKLMREGLFERDEL